jgi:sterol 14-demethylase
MSFRGGMHSCMGQNFAYLQVKTILSVLFREYEMEMVSKVMPEIDCAAMVVGLKGDCRVRYKKGIREI